MSLYRISILDLLTATAILAVFVLVNLQPTDIGSGVVIDAIGWPTKFHATTIADILETTTREQTYDVKTTLFFDWRNLTINILIAMLVAIATTFGLQLIRKVLGGQESQNAG